MPPANSSEPLASSRQAKWLAGQETAPAGLRGRRGAPVPTRRARRRPLWPAARAAHPNVVAAFGRVAGQAESTLVLERDYHLDVRADVERRQLAAVERRQFNPGHAFSDRLVCRHAAAQALQRVGAQVHRAVAVRKQAHGAWVGRMRAAMGPPFGTSWGPPLETPRGMPMGRKWGREWGAKRGSGHARRANDGLSGAQAARSKSWPMARLPLWQPGLPKRQPRTQNAALLRLLPGGCSVETAGIDSSSPSP